MSAHLLKRKIYSFFLLNCLAFCCLLSSPSINAAEYTFPEYSNIYVNDYANFLDETSKQKLTEYLKESERRGAQMSLITINRLSDYNAGPQIEPFATALFNHWGVGHRDTNRGILILISRYDREMRIELGSGYDADWNIRAKRIIDDVFIPNFKKDRYQQGIERGVSETIRMITGSAPSGSGVNFLSKFQWKVQDLFARLGEWLWLLIIPIGTYVANKIRNIWRYRQRSCPACQHSMTLLDEVSDDKHLDGGQNLEEKIESVDYDVWQCFRCTKIQIHRYPIWFSGKGACPKCHYKTLETDTTIIESATTSSSGRKRLDYNCLYCGYQDYEIRSIPRKSDSSSSSSSSGSFGGGSSSGGGASGSW